MAHFTSAMLFAHVHGGCYIISSVGIEIMWYERNVMYSVCIYVIKSHCDLSVLAVSLIGVYRSI